MFNFKQIRDRLGDVCNMYEKTAPTVHEWANDLYIRLNSAPDDVRLSELLALESFYEDGTWEQPNYAANRIYKLQSRLGQCTVGHAGF